MGLMTLPRLCMALTPRQSRPPKSNESAANTIRAHEAFLRISMRGIGKRFSIGRPGLPEYARGFLTEAACCR
jgi:hypothetical protein